MWLQYTSGSQSDLFPTVAACGWNGWLCCTRRKYVLTCLYSCKLEPIFTTIQNCSSSTPAESAMIGCFARQGTGTGAGSKKIPESTVVCRAAVPSKNWVKSRARYSRHIRCIWSTRVSKYHINAFFFREKRYYAPICLIQGRLTSQILMNFREKTPNGPPLWAHPTYLEELCLHKIA